MNQTQNEKQNNQDLTNKILSRIESEEIKPDPRWQFVLKEDMFWTIWTLSVLIGAGAVIGIMYRLDNSGFKYYEITHDSFISFFYDALPILWIVVLGAIITLSYVNIRKTNKGYRYPLWLILCASVGASSVLGNILYIAGAGPIIDREISERFPAHRSIFMLESEKWIKPEKGLLAGDVFEFDEELQIAKIKDFLGKEWTVETGGLFPNDIENLLLPGKIRIVGLPATSTDTFYACFILPWDVPIPSGKGIQKEIDRPRMLLKTRVGERMSDSTRMNNCKGVRPYDILQKIKAVEI